MIDAERLLVWLCALLLGFGTVPALAADPATQPAIASDIHNPIVIPPPDAAGGGWADGGPTGEYFANPDLAGDPAFTRHDVRVDFDWGKFLPVGGSTAEPYKSFPRSNFAVRWTGRVVPRFSEDYVFRYRGSGTVSLLLKPAGAAQWQSAIDQLGVDGWFTTPIHLTAGQLCEVRLEYRCKTDSPAVSLHWSCPSAPEQVLDPVVAQGLNASSWLDYAWANQAKNSSYPNKTQTTDAHGNLTTDIYLLICDQDTGVDGKYELSFRGQAKVGSVNPDTPGFWTGKLSWDAMSPVNVTYDPATKISHASVQNDKKEGAWALRFLTTLPNGGANTEMGGLTDVRVMKPILPGSQTSHRVDEVVYRPFRAATAPYTCLRWLQSANNKETGVWTDRSLPGEMRFTRSGMYVPNSGGECWEMLIVLANECGKDLYVNLPMQADDTYLKEFAQLIRYGSDGAKPYDHEVENPKWPPLNPNLRLYVEIGNEIWNWGFGSTQDCLAANNRAVALKTPEGKIVCYDGGSNWRRWHALRTVRASDTFRRTAGDAAMGSRIRMLLEYEYDNANETAMSSYDFLDKWFNNGDGNHVPDPHPVRYYVWGGGGATYYSVGNPNGDQNAIKLPDGGFENGIVPDGTEASDAAGSGWTCIGGAAIYRNTWESTAGFASGKPLPPQHLTAAGYAFRVDKPLFARELGCYLQPKEGVHVLYLIGPKGVLAQSSVSPAGWGWRFAQVEGDPPRLDPGVDYYILSQSAVAAPNLFHRAIAAGPHFSIAGMANVIAGGADPAKWKITSAGDGAFSYTPVGVRATSAADTRFTGLMNPISGGQAAVIRAGGALTTKITFPTAGHFAFNIHAAGPNGRRITMMPFSITVNGKSVNPISQPDDRMGDRSGMGGWSRHTTQLSEVWGSGVFDIDAPGDAELRIAAVGKGPGWTVFDDITIASVDAVMESGFGAGQANGQVLESDYTKQLMAEASYARSFGLADIAYEAGWSLGGDFTQRPIQNWCRDHDPRATGINNVAENLFKQAGGFMNVWGVYGYWPMYDTANALSYPLVKSIEDESAHLPAEATNGIPLPVNLAADPRQIVDWGYTGRLPNDFSHRGIWQTWLVLSPTSGVWEFTVHAKGPGIWELEVDGVAVSRGSGDATAYVRLVKGQHGVRFSNRGGGSVQLDHIEIAK